MIVPVAASLLLSAEMMDDEQSITLFVAAMAALAALTALAAPFLLRRTSLRRSVTVLAVVGPVLGVAGSLIGTGAMTLSGHDVSYVLIVAAIAGLAAMVVGWRLARPLARDLDRVANTIAAISEGDSSARTGIDRADELGDLATTVDTLGQTLKRVESERLAADGERRELVSALSHDLRTPLASLLVSLDALEDDISDGPSHLRAMRRNVLALERLIEDLFLLARADSGSLGLQSEPLDLAELVDEAIEAIGPSAAERGIALSANSDRALPIEGDHTALGRVLRNLLDNAVRHAESKVAIDLLVGPKSPSNEGTAVLTISDDGPGFDSEFVPRAFERFSQADQARSAHGGAGLGLAIAETLVGAHGGSVAIGTEVGTGGVVTVELPVAEVSPVLPAH